MTDPKKITAEDVEQAFTELQKQGLMNDTTPDLPDGTRSAKRWLAAIAEDAALVRHQLTQTLSASSKENKAKAIAVALKEARRMESDIYRFARDIHGIDRETIHSQGPL